MDALWPRRQERFLGPNGGKAKFIQQVSNGVGIPAQDSCALFSSQTSHCLSQSPCVSLGLPASGLGSKKLAHWLERSGFLCPGCSQDLAMEWRPISFHRCQERLCLSPGIVFRKLTGWPLKCCTYAKNYPPTKCFSVSTSRSPAPWKPLKCGKKKLCCF